MRNLCIWFWVFVFPTGCKLLIRSLWLIVLSQRNKVICDPKSLVRGCKIIERRKEKGQWDMKKPLCDRRK